jgi:hypothetical protein
LGYIKNNKITIKIIKKKLNLGVFELKLCFIFICVLNTQKKKKEKNTGISADKITII